MSNPKTDTLRPDNCGGGWGSLEPSWVRAASRYSRGPAVRDTVIGFRCALRARAPRA